MSKFAPGDDVIVQFDGVELRGEIKTHTNGWYMTRIEVDPLTDHSGVLPPLMLRAVVCVPERDVRHATEK